MNAHELRYAVQLTAEGLSIVSEHSFILQTIPPVIHPQAFPAPSVVELHNANVFNEYDEHAAATAQIDPL